ASARPPARTVDWEGTPLVLKAVRGRLGGPQSLVRLAAAAAVRDEGDRDASPALRDRFTAETDTAVRREVAKALGVLRDNDALPLLTAALRDPSTPGGVRDEALSAVEAIGSGEA